jgi:hypothetical protein
MQAPEQLALRRGHYVLLIDLLSQLAVQTVRRV